MRKHRNSVLNAVLLTVVAAVALTALLRNEVFSGRTNVIDWDGYGYYLYLPGAFIYGDVERYAFAEDHLETYDVSSDLYQLMPTDNDRRFPIYNAGLAVIWTPAFLATHAVVKATGCAPADGMSFPYQLLVVLMGLLFVFLGLLYLKRWLQLLGFSNRTVALALVAIGLATNLFYYWVEKPAMTHGYLFALYAAFTYHLTLLDRFGARKNLLFCGLLAGLMCLVRSSEIVVFALPALVGLRDVATFRRNFVRTLTILAFALPVFFLQLLSYKIGTGSWWQNGYAGLGFDWLSPHLYEGFFSYRRGWLVYTPIMVFALVGIAFVRPAWRWAILLFTLANVYLLFSWHIWWYGNTFGSRPVTQSYALLALPLAAFLSWLLGEGAGKKKGKGAGHKRTVLLAVALAPFVFLNLFQHWQYNQRILPLDFTNQTYYWHVFGKTTLDRADYVYLDTDEKLPSGEHTVRSFGVVDSLWRVPPKVSREFTNLLEMNIDAADARPQTWLRTEFQVDYQGDAFDKWKFPGLVTEHRRGEETLKWVQVNIPRMLREPASGPVRVNISLPDLRAGDVVKQYVWNLSGDSLVVSQFEVGLLHFD